MRALVRRSIAWRSGGQLLIQLVSWATTILVIRLLVPADYGLMALAQLVIGLLGLFAGQGFAGALVAAPSIGRPEVARVFGALIMLGVVLAAAQALTAPWVAQAFREPRLTELLQVTAIGYPLATCAALPLALCQRAMDFRTPTLVEGAGAVVQALATLALALAGQGVWALALGQLAGSVARAGGFLAMAPGLGWPAFRLHGAGALMQLGGVMMLNGVLFYALAQAPVLIGGRLLSAGELGLYTTAFFLASLPAARFLPVLSEVGLAAYARLHDDRRALARSFRMVTRVVSLATFPLYAGLAATAPDLTAVVLGEQWRPATPHFLLIGAAMPAYTLFCLFGPPTYALRRPRVQTGVLVVGLVLMPPAFALAAGAWGAIGLSAAWAAAFPIVTAVTAARTLPLLGVAPGAFLADLLPPLVAATLMGAAVWTLGTLLPVAPAARLVGLIIAGAALYYALARMIAPAALADLLRLLRR